MKINLETYRKELDFLIEVTEEFNTMSEETNKEFRISDKLYITRNSTDAQFVYALGILQSQEKARQDLSLKAEEEFTSQALIQLHKDSHYRTELGHWMQNQKEIVQKIKVNLSPEEQIELMKEEQGEMPVRQ